LTFTGSTENKALVTRATQTIDFDFEFHEVRIVAADHANRYKVRRNVISWAAHVTAEGRKDQPCHVLPKGGVGFAVIFQDFGIDIDRLGADAQDAGAARQINVVDVDRFFANRGWQL
jgi:hypothetical protein